MEDDRPPIFGTWRRFYTILLVYLLALILIFYGLTRWLS
jgi:hypothetical protein